MGTTNEFGSWAQVMNENTGVADKTAVQEMFPNLPDSAWEGMGDYVRENQFKRLERMNEVYQPISSFPGGFEYWNGAVDTSGNLIIPDNDRLYSAHERNRINNTYKPITSIPEYSYLKNAVDKDGNPIITDEKKRVFYTSEEREKLYDSMKYDAYSTITSDLDFLRGAIDINGNPIIPDQNKKYTLAELEEMRNNYASVYNTDVLAAKGVDIKKLGLREGAYLTKDQYESLEATYVEIPRTGSSTSSSENWNNRANVNDTVLGSAGGGKLSFEDWLASYGTDTDKMFNEGAAALNYELQTWAAGYGARAEQLAQMGLSNSGVSDIYGANAYSAYVREMNNLYLAKIEKDEENRRNYQIYSDEYEAAQAKKTEAANNRISAAFTTYMNTYTPATAEAIRTSLIAQGLSEDEAASALAQLDTYYNNLPEDQRADVAAFNANVQKALDLMNDQYNAGVYDLDTLEKQVAQMYDPEIAKAAREKFSSFATNTGTSQRVLDAYNSIISSESGYNSSMKENLENLYENNGWSQEEIDKLIEMLEGTVKIEKESAADATVSEVGNVVVGTESVATLQAKLTDAARVYGVDSKEYKNIQGAVSSKIRETIEWAFKVNPDGTPKRLTDPLVAEVLGLDSSSWSEENEKNQLSAIEGAIMEKAKDMRTADELTAEDYNAVVSNWLDSEIRYAKVIEDSYARATGLQDAGAIVENLMQWKNKGAMTEDEYKEHIDAIIKGFEFKLDENTISWKGNNDNADACIDASGGTIVYDSNVLEGIKQGVKLNENLYFTNGKYYKYKETASGRGHVVFNWYEVDPKSIVITGDGVINTEAQRIGISDILVALLQKKQGGK